MLRAMDSLSALDTFRAFRSSLYDCLHRRADALFELTDALLTAEAVPSPVHLSLQPSHRRGWGSLYNALSRGRIDAQALRRLLVHLQYRFRVVSYSSGHEISNLRTFTFGKGA
jgi:hypothetical protein